MRTQRVILNIVECSKKYLCVSVHMCAGEHAHAYLAHVWKSEENLGVGLSLSFHLRQLLLLMAVYARLSGLHTSRKSPVVSTFHLTTGALRLETPATISCITHIWDPKSRSSCSHSRRVIHPVECLKLTSSLTVSYMCVIILSHSCLQCVLSSSIVEPFREPSW